MVCVLRVSIFVVGCVFVVTTVMGLRKKGDVTANLPAKGGRGRQLGRDGREEQGQGAKLTEGRWMQREASVEWG